MLQVNEQSEQESGDDRLDTRTEEASEGLLGDTGGLGLGHEGGRQSGSSSAVWEQLSGLGS